MLGWFAYNTLAAAVLAGLVLLACRLWRFRPAVQHALWLLVLVKLLTPPWITLPYLPWDLYAGLRSTEGDPTETASSLRHGGGLPHALPLEPTPAGLPAPDPLTGRTGPARSPSQDMASRQALVPAGVLCESSPKPTAQNARPAVSRPWWAWLGARWPELVLYGWAFGALGMLLVEVARAARFRKLLAQGTSPPAWFAEELGRLAERIGTRTPPSLVVPGLGSPVVWCLGRARLLWPSGLVEGYQPDRVRGVLLHELAHLRRRDHWVIWLEMAGACLWWWNPLFWFVRRRVRQSAEMACDAWVVWALPDQRRNYAESLIDVVKQISCGTAVAPAWGAIGESRRHFERRLTMIFQENVPRRLSWAGLIAIGLVAAIVLPGWTHRPAEAEPAAAGTPGADSAAAAGQPGEPNAAAIGQPGGGDRAKAGPAQPRPKQPKTPPGHRIVSLPIDRFQNIRAGEIRPGDQVDLLLEPRSADKEAPHGHGPTVLRAIWVTGIVELGSGAQGSSDASGKTVYLAVTPEQAETLLASESGLIRVAEHRPAPRPSRKAAAKSIEQPSIPLGYRVLNVAVDGPKIPAGQIRPGDQVDLLLLGPKPDSPDAEGRTVLSALTVFAVIDLPRDESAPGSPTRGTLSVLVTPSQAAMLASATERGAIRVAKHRPGAPPSRKAAAKSIELFRLEHRAPAEMLEILTALWRLLWGEQPVPADQVTVLAVIRRPAAGMYPGGPAYGEPGMGYPGSPLGGPPGMPSSSMYGGEDEYGAMEGPGGYMGGAEEYDMGRYQGSEYSLGPGSPPSSQRSGELRLAVDPRTNALIARGSQEAMQTARTLIKALDTPDDNLAGQFEKFPTLRLIRFRHRRTDEMLRVLRELGIPVMVTYVTDRPTPAKAGAMPGSQGGILIAAGPEADLEEIQKLIRSLDVKERSYDEAMGYEGYEDDYEADYDYADLEEGARSRRRSRGRR